MNHLAAPLQELNARLGAFAADNDVRILYVAVEPDLAAAARELAVGLEWHPDNTRPVFLLEAPHDISTVGWRDHVGELRDEYERRADAYERESLTLAALPPANAEGEPLGTFAAQLKSVADAFGENETGASGVIVVLAAASVDNPPRLANQLRALAQTPTLAGVRWIWVHPVSAGAAMDPTIVGAFDPGGWWHRCFPDEAQARRETDDLLRAMAVAARSGSGSPMGARPKVAPPPHPDDPPQREDLGDAGASAYLAPFLEALGRLRDGNPSEALPLLRQACDLGLEAKRTQEAIEIEILAATTAAGLGLRHEIGIAAASGGFERAIERAEAAGLPSIAAKAALVLGCFANVAEDGPLAAASFVKSATLANAAKLPALEFQSLRLAGELGVKAGVRELGAARLSQALEVVASMPATEVTVGGMTGAVGSLAEFCRQNGLEALAARAASVLSGDS